MFRYSSELPELAYINSIISSPTVQVCRPNISIFIYVCISVASYVLRTRVEFKIHIRSFASLNQTPLHIHIYLCMYIHIKIYVSAIYISQYVTLIKIFLL